MRVLASNPCRTPMRVPADPHVVEIEVEGHRFLYDTHTMALGLLDKGETAEQALHRNSHLGFGADWRPSWPVPKAGKAISITVEPTYACLTGDARVRLLSGQVKTLEELTREKKPVDVYAVDENNHVVPAIGIPRCYGKRDKLIRVLLDNGEEVNATLDHEFMLRTGRKVRADKLKVGDSLLPFYRKVSNGERMGGYEMVLDPLDQKWKFTHRIVYGPLRPGDELVHHANENPLDNRPSNLVGCTRSGHLQIHNHLMYERLSKNPELKATRYREIHRSLANWRNEHPDKVAEYGRKSVAPLLQWMKDNKEEFSEIRRKSAKENLVGHRKFLEFVRKPRSERHKAKVALNTRRNWAMKRLEKGRLVTREQAESLGIDQLDPRVEREEMINHKIVSLDTVTLKTPIKVYCLEVPHYHNFALDCGIFIGNCNLRCGYCMVFNRYDDAGEGKIDPEIAKEFVATQMNEDPDMDVSLGFFGGEATLQWPAIVELTKFFDEWCRKKNKKDWSKSLTTNATLITPEKAAWLAENNYGLLVSLDGDKELHDRYRKKNQSTGEGSFDMVMEGLQNLKNAGMGRRVTLRATYTAEDGEVLRRVKFLNELCDQGYGGHASVEPAYNSESTCGQGEGSVADKIAEKKGLISASSIKLLSTPKPPSGQGRPIIINTDWVRANAPKLAMHESKKLYPEYKAVADWYIARVKQGKPARYHHYTLPVQRLLYSIHSPTECGAGNGYLSLSWNGKISTCHRTSETYIGDVKNGIDETKRERWLDNRYEANSKCMACTFRNVCGGPCFTGDMSFPSLDGKEYKFRDFVGKRTEVYSYDEKTGKVVPGKATGLFTGYVDELIFVTLDNGEVVKCTTNHEWMLRDGAYRRADQLKPGDSLMPLYRKLSNGTEDKTGIVGYEMLLQPDGNWEFTHRMVAHHGGKPKGMQIIHHADFHKRNNLSTNLRWMTWNDHNRLHRDAGGGLTTLWKDAGFRERHAVRSREFMIKLNRTSESVERSRRKIVAYNEAGRPGFAERCRQEDYREASRRTCLDKLNDPSSKLSQWVRSEENNRRLQAASHVPCACTYCGMKFKNRGNRANHEKRKHSKVPLPKRFFPEETCELCGGKFPRKFALTRHKNKHHLQQVANHKVVSVERVSAPHTPVYCLGVDKYENFALTAGAFVHNCRETNILYGQEIHDPYELTCELASIRFRQTMRIIAELGPEFLRRIVPHPYNKKSSSGKPSRHASSPSASPMGGLSSAPVGNEGRMIDDPGKFSENLQPVEA